jgi:hypothetical protein
VARPALPSRVEYLPRIDSCDNDSSSDDLPNQELPESVALNNSSLNDPDYSAHQELPELIISVNPTESLSNQHSVEDSNVSVDSSDDAGLLEI